jgi:hypothetical protein
MLFCCLKHVYDKFKFCEVHLSYQNSITNFSVCIYSYILRHISFRTLESNIILKYLLTEHRYDFLKMGNKEVVTALSI